MDIEEAVEYMRTNHRGVLATQRSDGRPQMSLVAVGVDAEGRVGISSRETAMKTRNLLRDPFASICAFGDEWYGPWVQVEGTAEVVHLPEAMELLVDQYRSLMGEHPDWDDFRAAMARERRVLLRVTIERAGPNWAG